jgi:hypothetical protein
MPNTNARQIRIDVVNGPAVTWLVPELRQCVAARQSLLVVASATDRIRGVGFLVDGKVISVDRSGPAGLYQATWRTRGASKGTHRVTARVTTRSGKVATESRVVRKC